jgi:hypothetical protein
MFGGLIEKQSLALDGSVAGGPINFSSSHGQSSWNGYGRRAQYLHEKRRRHLPRMQRRLPPHRTGLAAWNCRRVSLPALRSRFGNLRWLDRDRLSTDGRAGKAVRIVFAVSAACLRIGRSGINAVASGYAAGSAALSPNLTALNAASSSFNMTLCRSTRMTSSPSHPVGAAATLTSDRSPGGPGLTVPAARKSLAPTIVLPEPKVP